MRFFIDCEFDGFKGELISFAMIHEKNECPYIYGIFKQEAKDDWVKDNVIPVLQHKQHPVFYFCKGAVAKAIADCFQWYKEVEVVADWPADIKHFCDLIEFKGGEVHDMPTIKFTIDWRLNSKNSKTPHNALDDAISIKESYYKLNPS